MDRDPAAALEFAEATAREAGALLLEGWRRAVRPTVHFKRDADLVTEYDRRAEALIVERIAAVFPDDGATCEEGGHRERAARPGAGRWLVDPIDGTVNFAHGLPYFAVSIALEVDGALLAGVVHAPALGFTFRAAAGAGAFRDDVPLRVSDTPSVDLALVATGFPYDRRTNPADNNVDRVAAFVARAQELRRLGAASLDLSFVACGWLDGYWEAKLNPWDVGAGVLLVREAGGRVTGYRGEPLDLAQGDVVASNGTIHDEMVRLIAPTLRHA